MNVTSIQNVHPFFFFAAFYRPGKVYNEVLYATHWSDLDGVAMTADIPAIVAVQTLVQQLGVII